MMMKLFVTSSCLMMMLMLVGMANAFVLHPLQNNRQAQLARLYSSVADDVDVTTILANLKQLLEHLQDGPDGGAKLLAASSPSWQNAIHKAVGAPDDAPDGLVAKALHDAMSRPNNQFAILMGNHDDNQDFEAVFPSDPVVDAEAGTVWVECQLRELQPQDELLVTMGISLVKVDNDWKIDELQWQDFRDAFYPGLSGREWLRAF